MEEDCSTEAGFKSYYQQQPMRASFLSSVDYNSVVGHQFSPDTQKPHLKPIKENPHNKSSVIDK